MPSYIDYIMYKNAINTHNDQKKEVINRFDNRGIHIHFPDGSTPKDGPSGGTAITSAIYSLFTNMPINKEVAITGEIDLDGNVTEIGGLDAKLNGAKRAGVKLVLIPEENLDSLEVGVKSKLMDGRLTLNGAIYKMDWRDYQTSTFNTDITAVAYTENVGNAEINGYEINANYALSDSSNITFYISNLKIILGSK